MRVVLLCDLVMSGKLELNVTLFSFQVTTAGDVSIIGLMYRLNKLDCEWTQYICPRLYIHSSYWCCSIEFIQYMNYISDLPKKFHATT